MLAEIMISMLLPGAVAGPAGIAAEPDDQDPPVRVSLDENGDYYPGHFAQVDVRTDFDGFLLVLHLDPAGQLRVLFPLEPYDDGFVEGSKGYEIVNRSGRGAFYVGESPGIGTVFAAYSEWPFQVKGYAHDRRWNYDALWISPDGNIETAMVDLVAQMAYDGWFDYDLVDYEVYGEEDTYAQAGYRIAYEPVYICCRPWYVDPWVGFGISINIGSGYPYYGYPYYFSYYPAHHYRPYYAHRPWYAHHHHYGYGGYYGSRRYRFKQPYNYDRGRGVDPYRPRGGVGIRPDRYALGPDRDGIDYRGRRSPSNPSAGASGGRRVTTVSTGGTQPGGGRPGRTPSYGGPERVRTSPPILIDRGATAPPGRRTTPGTGSGGGTTLGRPGRVGTSQPILIDRGKKAPSGRRASPSGTGSGTTLGRPGRVGTSQPVLIDRGKNAPTGRRASPRGTGSGTTLGRPSRVGTSQPVLIDRGTSGSKPRRTVGQTTRPRPGSVGRTEPRVRPRTGPSGARRSPTRSSKPTLSVPRQSRSVGRPGGGSSRSATPRPVSRRPSGGVSRPSAASRQPSRSASRPAPQRSARPSAGRTSRAPARRSSSKRDN